MLYTNVCKLGDKIGFRGYDDNGNRIQDKVAFYPSVFVSSQNQTEYTDIHGNFLEKVQPGSMWDCKEYIKQWKDIEGFSVFGQDNYPVQFLSTVYNHNPIEDADLTKLKIAYLDIETQSEHRFPDVENPNEEINAITIRVGDVSHVFGVGKFEIKWKDKEYHEYVFDREEDMLREFIQLWKLLDVDVVTGWNCKMFDIPYLLERVSLLFGESSLNDFSPWGKIWKKNSRDDYGNIRSTFLIYGIAIVDYLDLYKKYVFTPRESYKLDFIVNAELGENKLAWENKYSSMSEFYKKNFQMFMEYNIIDVDLICQLEDKLKLMELHLSIAYMALINFEDAFSPVRTWDAIIYNHLMQKNIVIPIKENAEKSSQYAGAYVKDPKPGMYDWVVSFDLASLYPSLIMQFNISPETLVLRDHIWNAKDQLPDKQKSIDTILSRMHDDKVNTSVPSLLDNGVDPELRDAMKDLNIGMTANGHLFTNNREGFLPHLMDEMFTMRKAMKKKMIVAEKELELIKAEMQKRGL